MIIDVTQEDINEAGHTCYSCPIARAAKRTLKLESGVRVYNQHTHVLNMIYPNTEAMNRFIEAFDNEGFVEPEKFEVHWGKYK